MSKRKNHSKNRKRRYQERFKETKQRAKNYYKQQAELVGGLRPIIETITKMPRLSVDDLFQNFIEHQLDKMFGIIAIDTETTGLNSSEDEILQISFVGIGGETMYSKYFKPQRHEAWEEAEKVNHITPEMVADCQSIDTVVADLNIMLSYTKKIIGYNTPFDLGFLRAAGVQIPESAEIIDVMQMFSEVKGEPDKWHKLVECAEYYGYKWEGAAHDSTADAKATMYCYNQMLKGGADNG